MDDDDKPATAATHETSGDDSLLRAALGMAARPALPALVGGQTIDAYTIEGELGAGGMGRVYRARDTRLGRDVAIKLHAVDERSGERLVREAQALARFAHPNVVTVYEVGSWNGHPWVAMEYVPGGSARKWLSARSRSTREIIAVYLAAAEGLAAAHAAGLVHRDFKPDNVLVGDYGRARVADFGLARELSPEADPSVGHGEEIAAGPASDSDAKARAGLTRAGQVVGTPGYMAPEQWHGEPVGAAADQFAFAVALWEALCGQPPFDGASDAELVEALGRPPRAPPARRMPRHIERALRRALARDPAERWPSMRALIAQLRRDPRRARVAVAIAGLVLAGGVGVWLAWPARPVDCELAGGEIDELLPASLVDQAIARAGDEQKPATGDRRQATGDDQKQATRDRRQAAGDDQKQATGDWRQATGDDQKQATGDRRQAIGDDQKQATGDRRQAIGDDQKQATGDRRQATGDDQKQATGDRRQATGDDRNPSEPGAVTTAAGSRGETAGAANARSDHSGRIVAAASAFRDGYRVSARHACAAELTNAQREAHAACLANSAAVTRLLYVAEVADRLSLVLAGPDPRWCDDTSRAAVDPRDAELDAATLLVEHDELAAARTIVGRAASGAARVQLVTAMIAARTDHGEAARRELDAVIRDARTAGDDRLWLAAVRERLALGLVAELVAEIDRHRAADPDGAYRALVAAAEVAEPPRALELLASAAALVPAEPRYTIEAGPVRARAFAALGRYDNAMAAATEQVQQVRQRYGERHPRVARALIDQARVQLAFARVPEALTVVREAAALLDGARDRSAVTARAELAAGELLAQHRDAAAERHLARARELAVAIHGDSHPDVAAADVARGLARLDRDDHAGALAALRPAVGVLESGTDRGALANALYSLAVAEAAAGERDTAVATIRRCIAIRSTMSTGVASDARGVGPEARGTLAHAQALLELAAIQNLRRDHEDALVHVRAALAMTSDIELAAWGRLEAARALIGLGRERERATMLLGQARVMYDSLAMTARVAEIDELLRRGAPR